jgi:hypothetical protein
MRDGIAGLRSCLEPGTLHTFRPRSSLRPELAQANGRRPDSKGCVAALLCTGGALFDTTVDPTDSFACTSGDARTVVSSYLDVKGRRLPRRGRQWWVRVEQPARRGPGVTTRSIDERSACWSRGNVPWISGTRRARWRHVVLGTSCSTCVRAGSCTSTAGAAASTTTSTTRAGQEPAPGARRAPDGAATSGCVRRARRRARDRARGTSSCRCRPRP